MRWLVSKKTENYPTLNGEVIFREFLFLPYRIGQEKRWLEFVYIKRKFLGYKFSQYPIWEDIEFVDNIK